MGKQNQPVETILAKLSKETLSGNQIQDILNNPIKSPEKLIEELSLVTVLKYWNGQMSYSDGNFIMNNLFLYWTASESIDKDYLFSGIAWECYLAFDAGEFYRNNDDRSIDLSEKYTKPLVETLLRKQKQII